MTTDKIIDGVEVTKKVDEDGNEYTHFEHIVHSEDQVKEMSLWEKICSFFSRHEIKPYITKRDLSDPFGDRNTEGGNKAGYEAGIKGTF